jgi:hypothetical protein
MTVSRAIALALAATFALVGLVFLVAPGSVGALFEQASQVLAIRAFPAGDAPSGLFRALAAAYMYVVTWLAWMTARRPAEAAWPTALAHAKLASAAVSFALVVSLGASLVLVTNGIVDGLLGLLALWLRRQALTCRPEKESAAA